MHKLSVTLISGRSTGQGVGISEGKDGEAYREATGFIELNPSDMDVSGMADGCLVRVVSIHGAVAVPCRKSDIPQGLAFMAFGSACNRLVGGETYASGMPDSKHLQVEIQPLARISHQVSSRGGVDGRGYKARDRGPRRQT